MSAAERQVSALQQENRVLTTRAAQLQSNAYVEQIARQEYGLVRPGEQAYGILLPPRRRPRPRSPRQRVEAAAAASRPDAYRRSA